MSTRYFLFDDDYEGMSYLGEVESLSQTAAAHPEANRAMIVEEGKPARWATRYQSTAQLTDGRRGTQQRITWEEEGEIVFDEGAALILNYNVPLPPEMWLELRAGQGWWLIAAQAMSGIATGAIPVDRADGLKEVFRL